MTNEDKINEVNTLSGMQRFINFMKEVRSIPFHKDKSVKMNNDHSVKYLTIQELTKQVYPVANRNNIYIDFMEIQNVHGIRFLDALTGDVLKDWSWKNFVAQSHTVSKTGKNTCTDAQLTGMEQTYTIRYHLYLVLGIFPDDDNDGTINKTYNNISEDNKIADYNINTKNNAINELIKKYNDLYDRCTSLKLAFKFQKLSCDKLLSWLNINDINDINEKHIADIKTTLDKRIYVMESQLNQKNDIQIKEPISNFINNGNGMRKIGE